MVHNPQNMRRVVFYYYKVQSVAMYSNCCVLHSNMMIHDIPYVLYTTYLLAGAGPSSTVELRATRTVPPCVTHNKTVPKICHVLG